jgi:hypothetical protein
VKDPVPRSRCAAGLAGSRVVTMMPGSVGALADALRRAAAAHDRHAKDIGHGDPDWPDWHAQYLADESAGPDMNA